MHDLPVRHSILASELQSGAVHEVQHYRIGQLLNFQVRNVGHLEFLQGVSLHAASLVLHSLRDREEQVAVVVDLYYAAFPELWMVSLFSYPDAVVI